MARWLYMILRICARSSVGQSAGVDAQIVAGLHPALDRRAVADFVEPAFEIFELADVLALRLRVDGPGIGDHVGDRVFVAGEIAPVVEPVVHDAVEPVGLVGEAANGVGEVARIRPGAAEMTALAELRALIGHLPHDPLGDLVFAADILREEPPLFLGEIHHDCARFEDADRRPAALGVVIDQHRHAVVRIDLQEFGLELIAAPDIARHEIVVETQFLEQDRHLLAVGCRPKMEIEHRKSFPVGRGEPPAETIASARRLSPTAVQEPSRLFAPEGHDRARRDRLDVAGRAARPGSRRDRRGCRRPAPSRAGRSG